jgi:nucleoside-diphosphate-sugar epimerase
MSPSEEQPKLEFSGERTAAVTGANGYVGSRIATFLGRSGFRVVELRRDARETGTDSLQRHFTLQDPLPDETLADVDLLVHAAYDFRPHRWRDIEAINVEGSIRLLDSAQRAGVGRVVLISTMSSFSDCKSLYGRAKRAIETETLDRGGAAVRPGLVFGPDPRGMVGQLIALIEKLPVVPIIGSGNQVLHCAHHEDLGRLILELGRADPQAIREPVIAASEIGLTLRRIIGILAEARGRRARIVPLPWRLVWTGLKAAETAGLGLGMRSDSVVSLVNQDLHPDFEATRRSGVHFRDFDRSSALS